MKIDQQDNGKKGSFYIEHEGERAAEMIYVWKGDKLVIEHTEVAEALRGKGAAKKMLMEAVAYAREHKKKILPLCSYAASVFERTPEIRDVL
ncbi:GNAT family N-acetyltransferase [Pseudozobellia thermophila]|uniref:Uncharacterized protein n=1 Tax=Pseudozobellia thermophila TaxID=192903 RepID=A0A1M6JLD6_9FLAO|nr:GNAT family N-acetyltransferase [Pseudozobellia thermophila]SHJ47527.1 hypothetical protein SAMN04488513_10571 [Pseudozobellia thermophila]